MPGVDQHAMVPLPRVHLPGNCTVCAGFHCQAVTCSSIRLTWQAPLHLGQPPMHKYKLERQLQTLGAGQAPIAAALGAEMSPDRWITAHGELDDEDISWQDSRLQVCQPARHDHVTSIALQTAGLPDCRLGHQAWYAESVFMMLDQASWVTSFSCA